MADLMMEVPLADGHSVVVEVDQREVPGELVLAAVKPYVVAARATDQRRQDKPELDEIGPRGQVAQPLVQVSSSARSLLATMLPSSPRPPNGHFPLTAEY